MNVFVVRPFGTKTARDGVDIDFELVQNDLIQPAVDSLGLSGGTTGEILASGNIRRDMFQRLLTADLVIADLSIHNANVFYELGIRHALRDKRTFLIRSKSDDVPFDLKTDRYLEYDRVNPAKSKEALVFGLRATLDSESKDSPIFEHLPSLTAADPGRFVVVPLVFREDLGRAKGEGRAADIALLASELTDQDWSTEAWRMAGRALIALNAWRQAVAVWKRVRAANEQDPESNLALGKAYQRMSEFVQSDQALKRLLERTDLEDAEQASTLALMGRNSVDHWIKDWQTSASAEAAARALCSPHLHDAYERFLGAFRLDLHSFPCGCDALWTGTLLAELAASHPDVWGENFDTDDLAQVGLSTVKQSLAKVRGAVELALDVAQTRNSQLLKTDTVLLRCRAEVTCLSAERPQRASAEYRKAAAAADPLEIEEMRERLRMYIGVGVRKANTEAALVVLDEELAARPVSRSSRGAGADAVAVFSGRGLALGDAVARDLTQRLRTFVADLQKDAPRLLAFAAASPAGLLFYEVCEELMVPGSLWVSYPRAEYRANLLAREGEAWSRRFDDLADRAAVKILQASAALPSSGHVGSGRRHRTQREKPEETGSWAQFTRRSRRESRFLQIADFANQSNSEDRQVMRLGRRGQWWAMDDSIGGNLGVHGNVESVSYRFV